VIKNANCSALSTDFKNAANIISSLSGGFYKAELMDESVTGTHIICVEVHAGSLSITLPNKKFIVDVDCSKVLTKVNS